MDVAKVYDKVSEAYSEFYNNDIYSIEEDRLIAQLLMSRMPTAPDGAIRIADLGCGAGWPRVIWDEISASHALHYDGCDISDGMIEQANEAYAPEMTAGHAAFRQADIRTALSNVPASSYDLVVSLHGVFSHLRHEELPPIMAEIQRILRPGGTCVLGFYSRFADCRAPEHPRVLDHECRQLGTAVDDATVTSITYTADEVRQLFAEAGMTVDTIQGFGVEGGDPDIHGKLVERQNALDARDEQGGGRAVREAQRALRNEAREIVEADAQLGRKNPERAHEIMAFARRK